MRSGSRPSAIVLHSLDSLAVCVLNGSHLWWAVTRRLVEAWSHRRIALHSPDGGPAVSASSKPALSVLKTWR
jgi:hypothetical protein